MKPLHYKVSAVFATNLEFADVENLRGTSTNYTINDDGDFIVGVDTKDSAINIRFSKELVQETSEFYSVVL